MTKSNTIYSFLFSVAFNSASMYKIYKSFNKCIEAIYKLVLMIICFALVKEWTHTCADCALRLWSRVVRSTCGGETLDRYKNPM